jgi:hypothetical protein
MRRSARTDLCGGRSAMIVPTASTVALCSERNEEESLERAIVTHPVQTQVSAVFLPRLQSRLKKILEKSLF